MSTTNNFAELYPDIAKEWHPSKNGNKMPVNFSKASKEKIWWLCKEKHEYIKTIQERTSQNRGCPFCSGYQVCIKNSLAFLFPDIARDWHPTKNGSLAPTDVTKISSKNVWWMCSKGHTYKAIVSVRIKLNANCPYCSSHRICETNSLKNNFPNIANEWHPTKNGNLEPDDVTKASNKKVWWLCPKGHEYQQTICQRTIKKYNCSCPYCSGRRVSIETSLATLSPRIAKEWHPIENGNLTPDNVTNSSSRKVWWLCPRGRYGIKLLNLFPYFVFVSM